MSQVYCLLTLRICFLCSRSVLLHFVTFKKSLSHLCGDIFISFSVKRNDRFKCTFKTCTTPGRVFLLVTFEIKQYQQNGQRTTKTVNRLTDSLNAWARRPSLITVKLATENQISGTQVEDVNSFKDDSSTVDIHINKQREWSDGQGLAQTSHQVHLSTICPSFIVTMLYTCDVWTGEMNAGIREPMPTDSVRTSYKQHHNIKPTTVRSMVATLAGHKELLFATVNSSGSRPSTVNQWTGHPVQDLLVNISQD